MESEDRVACEDGKEAMTVHMGTEKGWSSQKWKLTVGVHKNAKSPIFVHSQLVNFMPQLCS